MTPATASRRASAHPTSAGSGRITVMLAVLAAVVLLFSGRTPRG